MVVMEAGVAWEQCCPNLADEIPTWEGWRGWEWKGSLTPKARKRGVGAWYVKGLVSGGKRAGMHEKWAVVRKSI